MNTFEKAYEAHQEGFHLAVEFQGAKYGLDSFLMAHKLEPGNTLYAADLALALHECDRNDEARQVCLNTLDKATPDWDSDFSVSEFQRIGAAYGIALEDESQALSYYARACVVDPDDAGS